MRPRLDLRDFLQAFVEQHRGLRFGKIFGRPAGYAGRRVFAYVTSDGLAIRSADRWVIHRSKHAVAARTLLPLLEIAARQVAEAVNPQSSFVNPQ